MAALPIVSSELGRRLMRVDVAYTIARMKVIEAKPGNPFGVEIRRMDDAAALTVRDIPSPNFNRVVGLRGSQEGLAAELDDWYRASEVEPRFEIMPGDLTVALARALARRGYMQTGFDAVVYGVSPSRDSTAADLEILEIRSPELMEEFLGAYLAGWQMPAEYHDGARANMRGWLGLPGWRPYLARLAGRPAGIAVLFVQDSIGYFADMATDPDLRRRGVQTALLAQLAAAARDAGVELIGSRVDYASVSHRNMERCGMRVLHTRAIWTAG